jgi:hypothetical protein
MSDFTFEPYQLAWALGTTPATKAAIIRAEEREKIAAWLDGEHSPIDKYRAKVLSALIRSGEHTSKEGGGE